MLSSEIERAAQARFRRAMFAIQAAPRTARAFGYPPPPKPPTPDVIRHNIIEGCKRDAAAGLLEREVSYPCRKCHVVHEICDFCPLKEPTE